MITPDEAGLQALRQKLEHGRYDCVVIGGGLRLPPKNLQLFERVVNLVHAGAPGAAIAFNEGPETTPDAVTRVLR
jgi:hypothetical protein